MHNAPRLGHMAVMAHYIKTLNAELNATVFVDHQHQPIPLLAPLKKQQKGKWEHDWRTIAKDALVRMRNAHRREFGAGQQMRFDFVRATVLYRRIENPKDKALLEVILSGGMLTGARLHAKNPAVSETCPLCGDGVDTELHRFWEQC